jgi:hypothetical protein
LTAIRVENLDKARITDWNAIYWSVFIEVRKWRIESDNSTNSTSSSVFSGNASYVSSYWRFSKKIKWAYNFGVCTKILSYLLVIFYFFKNKLILKIKKVIQNNWINY